MLCAKPCGCRSTTCFRWCASSSVPTSRALGSTTACGARARATCAIGGPPCPGLGTSPSRPMRPAPSTSTSDTCRETGRRGPAVSFRGHRPCHATGLCAHLAGEDSRKCLALPARSRACRADADYPGADWSSHWNARGPRDKGEGQGVHRPALGSAPAPLRATTTLIVPAPTSASSTACRPRCGRRPTAWASGSTATSRISCKAIASAAARAWSKRSCGSCPPLQGPAATVRPQGPNAHQRAHGLAPRKTRDVQDAAT